MGCHSPPWFCANMRKPSARLNGGPPPHRLDAMPTRHLPPVGQPPCQSPGHPHCFQQQRPKHPPCAPHTPVAQFDVFVDGFIGSGLTVSLPAPPPNAIVTAASPTARDKYDLEQWRRTRSARLNTSCPIDFLLQSHSVEACYCL